MQARTTMMKLSYMWDGHPTTLVTLSRYCLFHSLCMSHSIWCLAWLDRCAAAQHCHSCGSVEIDVCRQWGTGASEHILCEPLAGCTDRSRPCRCLRRCKQVSR